MSESPDGWTTTRLAEIVATRKGKKPDVLRQDKAEGLTPYLDIQAIENNCIRRYADIESSRLGEKDDLFVVWDGARSGWVGLGQEGAIGSTIMALESFAVESRYLYYFIKSSFDYINSNTRGTGIPHVDPEIFGNLEVPLPPLNEQHRIVLKLEKLLGRVNAAQVRLATIPRILKQFRQSLLSGACSGRLTADWREENQNAKPVSLVIESTDPTNSALPSSWVAVRVGDVINNLKYGTSQKCSFEKEGVPVLRIPNIGDGVIDTRDIKFAKLPQREFQQLALSAGDILLIRSNGSVSLIGKSALVRESENGFAYAGYLIRLRPNRSYVVPEFLNLALLSHDVRLQIEIPARSTSGVNNVNSTEVKTLKVGLPPLEEQQEIVRRVDALFKTADALEARYRTAKAHVDKLTQSILAKAFRGELVPQDPNDEPATLMLELINKKGRKAVRPKRRRAAG